MAMTRQEEGDALFIIMNEQQQQQDGDSVAAEEKDKDQHRRLRIRTNELTGSSSSSSTPVRPSRSCRERRHRASNSRFLVIEALLFSLLLLLVGAQEETTAPTTATTATTNENNGETELLPLSMTPTIEPSALQICEPSNCDSRGGIYLMAFVLEGTAEEGIMDAQQKVTFQNYMVNLTAEFVPEGEALLVRTQCTVLIQDQVDFGPLTPLQTGENAITETIVPEAETATAAEDTEGGGGRYRQLILKQQVKVTTTKYPNNSRQLQGGITVAPSNGNNETSFFFQYYFQLQFASSLVNITTYPTQFETYANEEVLMLSGELARLLAIEPERVFISDIREVAGMQPVTPEPTASTPAPTLRPSISPAPTLSPTVSFAPTKSPRPSVAPSTSPTNLPSVAPSFYPTFAPTFAANSTAVQNYALDFTLQAGPEAGFLNASERSLFCNAMEAETVTFVPEEDGRVVTTCVYTDAISKISATPSNQAPGPNSNVESNGGLRIRRLRKNYIAVQHNDHQHDQHQDGDHHDHDGDIAAIAASNSNTTRRTALLRHSHQNRQYQEEAEEGQQQQRQYRQLQGAQITTTYTYYFRMLWSSSAHNVSTYPTKFQEDLVGDAAYFEAQLTSLLGLDSNNNLTFTGVSVYETNSEAPSFGPTGFPSEAPSLAFTIQPTLLPSSNPTVAETPSNVTTGAPSAVPSTPVIPPEPTSSSNGTIVVVVSVVVGVIALVLLFGLAFLFQQRQSKLEIMRAEQSAASSGGGAGSDPFSARANHGSVIHRKDPYETSVRPGGANGDGGDAYSTATGEYKPYGTAATRSANGNGRNPNELVMSPSTSESILSNPSLLSNGQDDDDDDDDDLNNGDDLMARSSNPLDDFDQFKDQNLETMRSSVLERVVGIDGMMSQALTMALMGGGNPSPEVLWGGGSSGVEIEVNALCEVTDWVKRNDYASFDDQQHFMQVILNKMVISVRQGFLGPDDAARTIHECACLLNLQLANDLPIPTLILSGMRKTAKTNDVIRAFRRFGPVEDAAVASNERGFGLVRFRSQNAVEQAIRKFRTNEIVVQDVAVQVKFLCMPGED